MKVGLYPIIVISTENEIEFNNVIELCQLLNIKPSEQEDLPYSVVQYISVYMPNNIYQPITSPSTIFEWNCTAKEFINSNF